MYQNHLIEIARTDIHLYVAVHTKQSEDICLTKTLMNVPISPSQLDDLEQAIATAKAYIHNQTAKES